MTKFEEHNVDRISTLITKYMISVLEINELEELEYWLGKDLDNQRFFEETTSLKRLEIDQIVKKWAV